MIINLIKLKNFIIIGTILNFCIEILASNFYLFIEWKQFCKMFNQHFLQYFLIQKSYHNIFIYIYKLNDEH